MHFAERCVSARIEHGLDNGFLSNYDVITISGAGDKTSNGRYVRKFDPKAKPGFRRTIFVKDDTHQIYKWNNTWRIAHFKTKVYYEAKESGNLQNLIPPQSSLLWRAEDAMEPLPNIRGGCASKTNLEVKPASKFSWKCKLSSILSQI